MTKYNFVKHDAMDRSKDIIKITHTIITFSLKCLIDNNILKYESCFLYYDKYNNTIGISFNKNSELGSYHLSKNKYQNSITISCRAFLKNNNIVITKPTKYSYEKIKDEKIGEMLIIKL
jgi:hypothetical protein